MTLQLRYFGKHLSFHDQAALAANYLLMLYAFLLPVAPKAASKVFIVIAVLMLFSGGLKKRFADALKNAVIISFLLFYLMHALWMFNSEHVSTALFKLKEFKYLLFVLVIAMIVKKEFVHKILSGFIAGMLFSEIISYCILFGVPLTPLFEYIPFITLNIFHTNVPFLLNHTTYGICLSFAMSIILYQLLTHRTKNVYTIILLSFFMISATINIFLIESRLGYILYAFNMLFTLLFVFRKKLLKTLSIATIIVSLGYSLAFHYSPFFKDRVIAMFNDATNSLDGSYSTPGGIRIGYYIYGWEVIKANPIFGVGTGDHISEVISVIDRQETNETNKNALYLNFTSGDNASFDSEYLDTIVQFGIVGLIVFFNIIFQIIRYDQSDTELKYIQSLLAFSMLIIAGPSLIFIQSEVGKVIILLISLTFLHTAKNKKESA
jgi:O-antigen ligase